MKTYYIVTHGEAQHHLDSVVGGWFDSELTPKGIRQAKDLATFFLSKEIVGRAAMYSSDLTRCKQTAEIISNATGLQVSFDERLREMSFGKHEGMDQALHNSIMTPSAKDPGDRMDHAICEGAETRRFFASRLSDFVSSLTVDVEHTIIITHGFAASFLIGALQRIPVDSMSFISFKIPPGGVAELIEDDIFKNVTLTQLNLKV